MDTEESKGPIDFDFFGDDAEKDSQISKHRTTNGIRHLSKESLSQHDKAIHSTDNTRPSEAIQTNGRFKDTNLSDSDNDSTSDDSSESESDGERTARTVSSRSTNISVKVPSALDNISDTESDGNSSGASRDSENDDRENNNEIRPKKENGHKLTTGMKNPEPKETPSGSEKKASRANARPKTAKAGRKHHDSWTSEDVSDRNGSDLSRSFSSSETESKSSGDSDSDSSVTDVSPIHSPDRSKKCEGLDKSFEKRQKPKERSRKAESVRFVEVTPGYSIHGKSRSQNQDSETRELSMLLRAVLEMDECPSRTDLESLQRKMNRPSSGRPKRGGKRPQSAHLPHQRMNMSFSNNEVQRIDRENQRLLGKILHNKPQVPATRNSKLPGSSEIPGQHMSHASVRRKREQRKIELENMVSGA